MTDSQPISTNFLKNQKHISCLCASSDVESYQMQYPSIPYNNKWNKNHEQSTWLSSNLISFLKFETKSKKKNSRYFLQIIDMHRTPQKHALSQVNPEHQNKQNRRPEVSVVWDEPAVIMLFRLKFLMNFYKYNNYYRIREPHINKRSGQLYGSPLMSS